MPIPSSIEQNDFSDCQVQKIQIQGIVDCPLICVDINAPLTTVGHIDCLPSGNQEISDAEHLCDLVHCACDIQSCLEKLYGDIDGKVQDRCCLTYTGPVGAVRVRIDLENCRIAYEDFFIPGCSDLFHGLCPCA